MGMRARRQSFGKASLHPSGSRSVQRHKACPLPREPSDLANDILCRMGLNVYGKNQCSDLVVGAILASWRYDISGISPDMRKDYEHP